MSKVQAGDFRSDLLGLYADQRSRVPQHTLDATGPTAGRENRQQSEPGPGWQRAKNFSDKDIDTLLKHSGVEITPGNRRLARFFLLHRIQLQPDLFTLMHRLWPHEVPRGPETHALIAALSKLPIEQVEQGYRVVLETMLEATSVTVMNLLQKLRGAISDIISTTFSLDDNLELSPQLLRDGFEEWQKVWDQLLKDDSLSQIRTLVWRRSLIFKLHRHLRTVHNLGIVLSTLRDSPHVQGLLERIRASGDFARRALNMMLTDSILSREDVHHHLKEQGACHSLGLLHEGKTHPCRLWVHDRDNPSARALDDGNVVLFFRWVTRELGMLECRVVVEDEKISVRFASEHESVRSTLGEEKHRLESALKKLGFEVRVLAVREVLEQHEPLRDIETKVEKLTHLDTQA